MTRLFPRIAELGFDATGIEVDEVFRDVSREEPDIDIAELVFDVTFRLGEGLFEIKGEEISCDRVRLSGFEMSGPS